MSDSSIVIIQGTVGLYTVATRCHTCFVVTLKYTEDSSLTILRHSLPKVYSEMLPWESVDLICIWWDKVLSRKFYADTGNFCILLTNSWLTRDLSFDSSSISHLGTIWGQIDVWSSFQISVLSASCGFFLKGELVCWHFDIADQSIVHLKFSNRSRSSLWPLIGSGMSRDGVP